VLKWELLCGSSGTVWLAMWKWHNEPSTIKLIGKHNIEVTAAVVDQIAVRPYRLLLAKHHKFSATFVPNLMRQQKIIT